MAYLAINGYELPSPKRGVEPIVTTLVDAGRDAMVRLSASALVVTSTNLTTWNGRG